VHILFLLFLSLLNPQSSPGASVSAPQNAPADTEAYRPVETYSIVRNPDIDLGSALREAERSNRNVILEIGGDWCIWCRIMDKFFADNPDLLALREKNYVTVKINMSPLNENRGFLSKYPRIPGYPHLFVVDADNKLIKSQNTSELEDGKSYNLKRFTQFLEKYSPAAPSTEAVGAGK
jgi:thiol:disulfide interchange protein